MGDASPLANEGSSLLNNRNHDGVCDDNRAQVMRLASCIVVLVCKNYGDCLQECLFLSPGLKRMAAKLL
jgi:hypothetical protein